MKIEFILNYIMVFKFKNCIYMEFTNFDTWLILNCWDSMELIQFQHFQIQDLPKHSIWTNLIFKNEFQVAKHTIRELSLFHYKFLKISPVCVCYIIGRNSEEGYCCYCCSWSFTGGSGYWVYSKEFKVSYLSW